MASAFRRKNQLERRPAICTLRARQRSARGRFWAWRVVFTDDAGRPIWESLLSIRGDVAVPMDDRHVADLARDVEHDQLASVVHGTRAGLSRLAEREHAIGRFLRSRHARLAAALLQPGLFDRRAERAAAAQATLVNEALARSTARLDEIDAAGRPRTEERRLAFAVTLE